MTHLKEGITLRDFINLLEAIAKTEGNKIEVIAFSEIGQPYNPIIHVGPDRTDGIRRVSVAG